MVDISSESIIFPFKTKKIDNWFTKSVNNFSHNLKRDLTEAGAYPQLPTQPKFFDHFQTYTAI